MRNVRDLVAPDFRLYLPLVLAAVIVTAILVWSAVLGRARPIRDGVV